MGKTISKGKTFGATETVTNAKLHTLVDDATITKVTDADNDTKIDLEESSDEDIIRFDTDGTERLVINSNGINFAIGKSISDIDGDTKVQLEESSDDDIIRFDTAGTERITIQAGKIEPTTDDNMDLGASGKEFKDLHIDGTANIDTLALATGATVTGVADEDDMTSDSATLLATQQSIKAYVDNTQPSATAAFQVIPTTSQTNIVTGSPVTIIWGTEVFDIGGNFVSNTFTAPQDGKYQLNVSVVLEQMDSDASFYQVFLITSNRIYEVRFDPRGWDTDSTKSFTLSVVADMDINDTAIVRVEQTAGTQQTDIVIQSIFSGSLI